MKKILLLLSVLIAIPVLVSGQFVLENFDILPDSTTMNINEGATASQWLDLSLETTTVHAGDGALLVDWQNQCESQWGGWTNLGFSPEDSLGLFDFSLYTEFSIWYYVVSPSSTTDEVDFRILLDDVGPENNFAENGQEVWISQHYIFDAAPGWNQLVIPLIEGEGATPSEGFGNPNWSGTPNNGKLDLDKIRTWHIEWSQRANLYQQPMDTVWGTIIFDDAELQGVAPVNLVFFNGVANPGNVNMHTGWSGAAIITDEDAYTPGTNSIKWTGGAGWDAVNFDLADPRNMVFNWNTDSIQFKIKAEAGTGDLNLFFWDVDHDTAKVDYAFQATYTLTEATMSYDGTWKEVKIPLRDFNRFAGVWDNDLGASVSGEFDSTEVMGFAIGNTGTAIATDVFFDDVWTGNPEFDWEPPAIVSGVGVAPGDFYNLVFWTDNEGEDEESYTVYASTEPITDVAAPGVEIVAQGVAEGTAQTTHWLYYPLQDKNIDYYYAIECKDAAGNVGPAGLSDMATNMGKGVPTIANYAPPSFAADGSFTEWANIMPWDMKPSISNTAAGAFDNDDDLNATIWMAMDEDYFYIAADVIDNVFYYDPAAVGSWWTQDALELFIGLWDQNGKAIHDAGPAESRGTEPDYKLIFLEDRYHNEYKNSFLGIGNDAELTNDDANYHFAQFSGVDYVMEAKISLDSIAFDQDVRFHPENGMRIMFDIVLHDNDSPNDVGGGNLTWSPNNTDLAYLDQHEWTNTWIGDTTMTGIADRISNPILGSYSLEQNYPNPFNPTTKIAYNLGQNTLVNVKVFNILGKEIVTLVNEKQVAGLHTIDFNAVQLSTGVYFYQIQAGDFTQTKKMLLVK